MRWIWEKEKESKQSKKELMKLLEQIKKAMEMTESSLNGAEDHAMIDVLTYRMIVEKQLFRYLYRLTKKIM
jgi:hypothetical protein